MSELREKLARRLSSLDSTETVDSIENIIQRNKEKNSAMSTPNITPVKLNHTTPNQKEPVVQTKVKYQLNPVPADKKRTKDTSSTPSKEHTSSSSLNNFHDVAPSTVAPVASPTSSSNKRSYTMLSKEEQADRDRAALIQRGLRLEPAEVKVINGRETEVSPLPPSKPQSGSTSHYKEQLHSKEQKLTQTSSEIDAADISLEVDLHSVSNTEEEEAELSRQRESLLQQQEALRQEEHELQRQQLAFQQERYQFQQQQQQEQTGGDNNSVTSTSFGERDEAAVQEVVRVLKKLQSNISTAKKQYRKLQEDNVNIHTKHNPELQINTEIREWTRKAAQGNEDEISFAILVHLLHSAASPIKSDAAMRTVHKTYTEFRQFRAKLGLSEEGVDDIFPPLLTPAEEAETNAMQQRCQKLQSYLQHVCRSPGYIGRNHVYDAVCEFLSLSV